MMLSLNSASTCLKVLDTYAFQFAMKRVFTHTGSQPSIKVLQIQLTGFLDKDTASFCKELWTLCLSAQSNPQGVPKELLEAKKLELIQEKVGMHMHRSNNLSLTLLYSLKRRRLPKKRVAAANKRESATAISTTYGSEKGLTAVEGVVEEAVVEGTSTAGRLETLDLLREEGAARMTTRASLPGVKSTPISRVAAEGEKRGGDRPHLCVLHRAGQDRVQPHLPDVVTADRPVDHLRAQSLLLAADAIDPQVDRGDLQHAVTDAIDPFLLLKNIAHVRLEDAAAAEVLQCHRGHLVAHHLPLNRVARDVAGGHLHHNQDLGVVH